MKVCYNNVWQSDEGVRTVRLQCEFDIAAGVYLLQTPTKVLNTLFLINFKFVAFSRSY